MTALFFSYSHRDEDLRDELEVHLSSLKRQGLIDVWHDRRIDAGENWSERIGEHLEEADVILLLVSPDFIASDYCCGVELKRALERHEAGNARVIPVILRPCDWQGLPFGRLQATPKDGKPITKFPNRDEAFLEVTKDIKKAVDARTDRGAKTPLRPRQPASRPPATIPELRSSNLRVRKTFTQHDKDVFLTESFEFISRFFESSLQELAARNEPIETRFRRVDANSFEAAIYREGNVESRCTIWLSEDAGFPGILYSTGGRGHAGSGLSFNEQLAVKADDQQLYLHPGLQGFMQQRRADKLSQQGAAEYLWEQLIRPLQ